MPVKRCTRSRDCGKWQPSMIGPVGVLAREVVGEDPPAPAAAQLVQLRVELLVPGKDPRVADDDPGGGHRSSRSASSVVAIIAVSLRMVNKGR